MLTICIFVKIVVFALAYLQPAEIGDEILEAHPEYSIILDKYRHNLFLDFCGPEIRIVRPVSIPLDTAPWVPNLHQGDRWIFQLAAVEHGVDVIVDQTVRKLDSALFFVDVATASHDEVFFAIFQHLVKQVFSRGRQTGSRRASQVPHHIMSLAPDDSFVALVQLGPSLLENDWPDLAVYWIGDALGILDATI